jgi:hypothetical protein
VGKEKEQGQVKIISEVHALLLWMVAGEGNV